MSREEEEEARIGELLALVVHDLRSPLATSAANISFARDAGAAQSSDVREALDDAAGALADLARGLDQLGWMGRWISGKAAAPGSPGDARASVEEALRRVGGQGDRAELPEGPVQVKVAGEPLTRLVEIFVRNARKHSQGAVTIRLGLDGVLEVEDSGRSVGADLRGQVFTLAGQQQLKGRLDGRYEWMAGLLAARALADGMGARLEAAGEDGAAVFRIHLAAAG